MMGSKTEPSSPKQVTDHKDTVSEYFRLIGMGMFKEGLRFFTPDCKTHNPYVAGGMGELTDAMIAASKNISAQNSMPEFVIKHLLVDGDVVAAHTQLLNSKSSPGEGGLRQVHVFRFEGDKIAEYWDITQQVLPSMPNAKGAF
jgi:predicted SnoaL-like aldol condensation-catalyzing enzyme